MPASIKLTSLEHQWLLKLIESNFNIDILDSYSCQKLSDLLLKKHKVSISYNTLRRIFGIISPRFQTSLYTLNAILKTLGFSHFRAFQEYIEKYQTDTLNEILIRYKATKVIDPDLLFDSVKHFTFHYWEESYQLKMIIELCIEIREYDLLKRIISMPADHDIKEVHHKLYVAYQGIYLHILNGDQHLKNFIQNEIQHSFNLQRILLQTYIDETNLTGFYGDFLLAVKSSKLPDFQLFKNLMLCQRSYLKNDKKGAVNFLALASKEIKKKKLVHPILRARLVAWEVILKRDSKNVWINFHLCLNDFEKINFILYFFRLLYEFNIDISSFDLISKVSPVFGFNNLSVFEKQVINKYNLISALYFDQVGATGSCLLNIQKIDPRSFDVNEGQWFQRKYEWLKQKYKRQIPNIAS